MRILAKKILNTAFWILALPAFAFFFIHTILSGQPRAIGFWSQTLGLIPGQTGVYFRRAFYSLALQAAQDDSVISFGVLFSSSNTHIGNKAYIGPYCVIGDASIGNDTLIGSQVSIMNGTKQHGISRLDIPIREQPGEWPRIIIGEDSWIGDRAVVMANIGAHCVIGAGSVVTKSIPDFAVAVGNPARIIRFRNEDQSAPLTKEPERPSA